VQLTYFFAYIGFDAVSVLRKKPKTHNAFADRYYRFADRMYVLYILVAAVLTGMVPWREVNIEAPIARAFLDRGLVWASHIITLGALAG